MPEGPEVRTITCKLDHKLSESSLTSIEVGLYSRYQAEGLTGLPQALSLLPSKILAVCCKGKLIVFIFQSFEGCQWYLTSSLGMTGAWLFEQGKYTSCSLATDQGNVYYDDVRKFGRLTFHFDLESLDKKLATIGVDLLQSALISPVGRLDDSEWLKKVRSASQRQQICVFLLDQKYVSGIGNYVRAEVLYRAQISPFRILSSLSEQDLLRLNFFAAEVLVSSFSYGGLTLRDYWDPEGKAGVFPCQVYGQAFDPQGNPVLKKDVGGRTIHYVEAVQK